MQEGEKRDPIAQQLIQEFCALINFPYQQQQGLFAVGFYQSVLPVAPARLLPVEGENSLPPAEGEPIEGEIAGGPPAGLRRVEDEELDLSDVSKNGEEQQGRP